jgi:hypothetical protein
MPRYSYSLLRNECHSIRLFRLLPSGDDNAIIRGELVEYNLQTSRRATHAYDVLSYVWGSNEQLVSILLGDDLLDVTPNLYAALSHLRDPSMPRIIWIDAICINQTDNEEKSNQIQSMARIYGIASRVLVWLGKEADNSHGAIEAIRTAGQDAKRIPDETMRGARQVPKRLTDGFAHPKMHIDRYSVNALLQCPWFRRIWVEHQTRKVLTRILKASNRYFKRCPPLGTS